MLSKFCDIRKSVVRFSQNDINGNEDILLETEASHHQINHHYHHYICRFNEVFMADLQNRISQMTSENNDPKFDLLKAALYEAIPRQPPIKQRNIRANQFFFHIQNNK